jgi:hypothetical protein
MNFKLVFNRNLQFDWQMAMVPRVLEYFFQEKKFIRNPLGKALIEVLYAICYEWHN